MKPSKSKSRPQGSTLTHKGSSRPLLVEVKFKNKDTKQILIADIHDSQAIDQEIQWFMTTNKLKKEAHNYIKTIIQKNIKAKVESLPRYSKMESLNKTPKQRQLNKQNEHSLTYLESNGKSSLSTEHAYSNVNTSKEPFHLEIVINSHPKKPLKQLPKLFDESFVFNSSFTLPSSIGEKERSFITDQIFQKAFETNEKYSEDFSNISEMHKGHNVRVSEIIPPLCLKEQSALPLEEPTFQQIFLKEEPKDKKRPQKITLTGRKRQMKIQPNLSAQKPRKSLSPKERKNALLKPKVNKIKTQRDEFVIYSSDKLQALMMDQKKQLIQTSDTLSGLTKGTSCLTNLPPSIQQDLQALFEKLTRHNPPKVKELHSQYVSYGQLSKDQLLFMGTLFEKLDHEELNNLNIDQFKLNAAKYCFKELEEMNMKRKDFKKNKLISEQYIESTLFDNDGLMNFDI